MSIKSKINAQFNLLAYNHMFDSFITSVIEYMEDSVKKGYTGIVYKESDVLCKINDFEAWLRKGGFKYYWKHSLFLESKLFIEFGVKYQ